MTVLIADQDKGFRSAVKKLLEVSGTVKIVWEAGDGEEAVELSRELHPDLVLIEISLPRINGLEATQMIKKTQPNVQVVVLTAYTDEVYRRAAMRSGADAVLPKSICWAPPPSRDSLQLH
jgi:DNA-binding NarL/FixJ family response regulator